MNGVVERIVSADRAQGRVPSILGCWIRNDQSGDARGHFDAGHAIFPPREL